jgi:hypothetical protein
MMSRFPVLPIAAAAAALLLASASFGDDNDNLRTADQAKAMLTKAVAAVKADKAKALDMFNKGEGGFRDGNLYVSCFNVSDGKMIATGSPNLKQRLGEDGRTFKDPHGSPLNLEGIAQKPEGQITKINVELQKPGDDRNKAPAPKEIYATKVEDLICGVGYYYWYNERTNHSLAALPPQVGRRIDDGDRFFVGHVRQLGCAGRVQEGLAADRCRAIF